MGVGNLSRRVGMNQSTREDRKNIGEAMGDVVAEKRPEKRERVETVVTDVTEDIRSLVRDFADVEAQLAVLNARRAELKEKATQLSLEHGVDDFTGPEGKVQVIVKKAPMNFDKNKAKTFLTEEQFKSCQKPGKVPAPSVKFIPPKED